MQRWKIQLGFDFQHLNGSENYVADALSIIKINNVDIDIKSTDATILSADEDNSQYIPITVNAYRTQIIIEKMNINEVIAQIRYIFGNSKPCFSRLKTIKY